MRRLPGIMLLASATIVVVLALLLSGLRLVIPHLDTWRIPILQKISAVSEMQITADALTGRWESFGPRLEVRNLRADLGNNDHLSVQRVTLALDVWQSLLHLRWQFRELVFWQLDLTTESAFPPSSSTNTSGKQGSHLQIARLNNLFLHQFDHFDLRDSEVRFVTPSGQHARLSIPQLTWQNARQRHRAEGLVNLSSWTGQHGAAQVRLDLRDSQGYPDTGRIWLQADDVDAKPWLGQWMQANTRLQRANVSLEAWMQITAGEISNADLWLKRGSAHWQGKDTMHHLQVDNLMAQMSRFQHGWQLDIPQLRFSTDNQPWPQSHVSLLWLPERAKQQGEVRLRAGQLDLAMLNPLIPLFSGVPTIWQDLQPQGLFQALAVDVPLDNPEQSRFQAEFHDVGWQQWQKLPGMQHLSGALSGSLADGQLAFSLQQATLPYSPMFRAPLEIQQASGALRWQYNADGLTLAGKQLDIQARSLWARGDFHYQQPTAQPPHLEILTGIRLQNAADAWRYFPEPLMGKPVADYLTGALKGGQVDNATLLFAGNPQHFPFRQNDGMFEVAVPLRNATYAFQPGWPALQNLNIDLDFANNGLWMQAKEAYLGHVLGSNITAVIPDYAAKKLLIDSELNGDGAQIQDYFNHTPLQSSLGAALEQLQVGGNVSGNLHLDIPLDGKLVRATGETHFKNNSLYIKPLQTTMQQLSGSLTYDNGNLQSSLLHSNWFGQPLAVSFNTREGKQEFQIGVDLQADWQPGSMAVVPAILRKQLRGHVPWQGKVQIALPHGGGAQYQADISSNLRNVSSHLPSPLALAAATDMPVLVHANGDLHHFDISGKLGASQHFNSRWLLNGQLQLDRAIWQDNAQRMPALPASSVLRLNLPAIEGEAWLGLAGEMTGSALSSSGASGNNSLHNLLPDSLQVQTPVLTLAGQQWQDMQVTLNTTATGDAQVNVQGKEIKGALELARSRPWRGRLDYLYYNPQWKASTVDSPLVSKHTQMDFSRWPALDLSCQECWLWGQKLGKIQALLTPFGDTLKLENGVIDNGVAHLTASGAWVNRAGDERTSLRGKLRGNNIAEATRWFGVDSPLLDSSFALNYDLQWQSAPWQPSLQTLKGKLHSRLGAGQIADVSTGRAGQLLRLVSVDALLRKLRFDFSDTFGQGFWFDAISGNARIENGIMYTDNLLLDGLEADIAMSGKMDLVGRNINMEAVVAPEISAPVGVGVAFVINPVVGAAVFAASKVLGPLWNKISVLRYHISGAVDKPEINEVLRTPRGINP